MRKIKVTVASTVREASALKTDVDVVKAFRRHIAKDPREQRELEIV